MGADRKRVPPSAAQILIAALAGGLVLALQALCFTVYVLGAVLFFLFAVAVFTPLGWLLLLTLL